MARTARVQNALDEILGRTNKETEQSKKVQDALSNIINSYRQQKIQEQTSAYRQGERDLYTQPKTISKPIQDITKPMFDTTPTPTPKPTYTQPQQQMQQPFLDQGTITQRKNTFGDEVMNIFGRAKDALMGLAYGVASPIAEPINRLFTPPGQLEKAVRPETTLGALEMAMGKPAGYDISKDSIVKGAKTVGEFVGSLAEVGLGSAVIGPWAAGFLSGALGAYGKGGTTEDMLKAGTVGAVSLGVGSKASKLLSPVAGKIIEQTPLKNTIIGTTINKLASGGLGFGVGGTAALEPISGITGYDPELKDYAHNALLGALFEAIPATVSAVRNAPYNKAVVFEGMKNYENQMKSDYFDTMRATAPEQRLAGYDRMIQKNNEALQGLRSNKFVGASKEVKQAEKALNVINDILIKDRGLVGDFTTQARLGNVLPEPAMRSTSMVPTTNTAMPIEANNISIAPALSPGAFVPPQNPFLNMTKDLPPLELPKPQSELPKNETATDINVGNISKPNILPQQTQQEIIPSRQNEMPKIVRDTTGVVDQTKDDFIQASSDATQKPAQFTKGNAKIKIRTEEGITERELPAQIYKGLAVHEGGTQRSRVVTEVSTGKMIESFANEKKAKLFAQVLADTIDTNVDLETYYKDDNFRSFVKDLSEWVDKQSETQKKASTDIQAGLSKLKSNLVSPDEFIDNLIFKGKTVHSFTYDMRQQIAQELVRGIMSNDKRINIDVKDDGQLSIYNTPEAIATVFDRLSIALPEKLTPPAYEKGENQIADAGKMVDSGVNVGTKTESKPEKGGGLDENIRKDAVDTGKAKGNAKKQRDIARRVSSENQVTARTESEKSVQKYLKDKFGVNVKYVNHPDKNINGMESGDGNIYINANSETDPGLIAAHEIVHFISRKNKPLFEKYLKPFIDVITKEHETFLQQLTPEWVDMYKNDPVALAEEILADEVAIVARDMFDDYPEHDTSKVGMLDSWLSSSDRYAIQKAAKELFSEIMIDAEKKPIEKIEDFGEKIGGARKDVWAEKGLTQSDLEGMTDREAAKYVTKDAIWPKIDYEALIESGIEPHVAYLIKGIRDALPAKIASTTNIEKNKEQRQMYIEFIQQVRDELSKIKGESDFKGLSDRILVDNGYYNRSAGYGGSWTEKGKKANFIENKFVKKLHVSVYDFVKAKTYVSRNAWPAKVESWKKGLEIRYSEKKQDWYIVQYKSASGGRIGKILEDGFKSKEEAENYMNTTLKESLTGRGGKPQEPWVPQLATIKYDGPDYRKGNDVTGQDLIDVFGFRGGEFGNWNSQADRQQSLNYAYNALMDLANMLGLSPKDISLNGELGIAFGARGVGGSGAKAHYEPTKLVINLTKMSGAGSLAHEWFHALDDYLGRIAEVKAGTLLSDAGLYKAKLPEDVSAAFKNLMAVIREKPQTKEEMLQARQSEIDKRTKYIERQLKSITDYLEKETKRSKYDRKQQKYVDAVRRSATQAEKNKIGSLVKNILENKNAKESFDKLVELHDEIKGVLPEKDLRDSIYSMINYRGMDADSLKEIESGTFKYTRTKATDFLKNAQDIDKATRGKPYWSKTEELLARAFGAYVQDALGHKSQYLVHSNENKYYEGMKTAEGNSMKPFPEGEEFELIKNAFGKLFDVLRKNKDIMHGKESKFRFSAQRKGEQEVKPFFSKLQQVISDKMPNKADKELVFNLMAKNGVKQEEIKWSGINDFMKGKDRIDKKDLLEFLKMNELQIEEIERTKDATIKYSKEDKERLNKISTEMQRIGRELFALYDENVTIDSSQGELLLAFSESRYNRMENLLKERIRNDKVLEKALSLVDALKYYDEEQFKVTVKYDKPSTPKYESYQLPGGENYRELLFQLPLGKTNEVSNELPEGYTMDNFTTPMGETWVIHDPNGQIVTSASTRQGAIMKFNGEQPDKSKLYQSSHWDEPNILAHVRLNDRVDAQGSKVLFVEEIQSDWHQEGRKKGYRKPLPTIANIERFTGKFDDENYWLITDTAGDKRQYFVDSKEKAIERFNGAREDQSRLISANGVPDAPFQKTWHEFALKRLIRYAAENGYDKIAWTTGDMQNNRYNLSKSIGAVEYTKDGKLVAYKKDTIVDTEIFSYFVPKDEIADYVGVEVAKKLLEQPEPTEYKPQRLSGIDLEIGGSGMKGFYDKIIPDFLNQYGKRWQAKVKDDVIGRDLTKTSAYKKGGDEEVLKVARDNKTEGVHVVQSFPITESMKKSVMTEGQALFSAKRKKQDDRVGEAEDLEGQISKFYTNTLKNINDYSDAERNIFDEADGAYNKVSEKKSLEMAKERLLKDFEGEVENLKRNGISSGVETDMAMGILEVYRNEGRATGDYTKMKEWAKLIPVMGATEMGRGIQAFYKYSRTPEDYIRKTVKAIEGVEKDILGKDPEKIKDIENETKVIDKLLDEADKKAGEETTKEIQKKETKEREGKKRKSTTKPADEKQKEKTDIEDEEDPAQILANKIKKAVEGPKTKEKDVVMQMVNELYAKFRETDTEGNLPKKLPPDKVSEFIEAIKNKDLSDNVWIKAKEIVREQFANDMNALAMIDNYFGKGTKPPFSEATAERAIRDVMKKMDYKLSDMVKDYFAKGKNQRADILEHFKKQAQEYNLSSDELNVLVNYVDGRFKDWKKQYADEYLNRLYKARPSGMTDKEAGALKFIDAAVNSGIFVNQKYSSRVSEKLDPKIRTLIRTAGINIHELVLKGKNVTKFEKEEFLRQLKAKVRLSSVDADRVARVAERLFDEEVEKARTQILKRMLHVKKNNTRKRVFDKVLDLINLDAYSIDTIRDIIKEKEGLPVLDNADIEAIIDAVEIRDMVEQDSYIYRLMTEKIELIMANKVPATMRDKIKGLQRVLLLLNVKTNVRNIGGNIILNSTENVKDLVGAPIDLITGRILGTERTTLFNPIEKIKWQIEGASKGANTTMLDLRNSFDREFTRDMSWKEIYDNLMSMQSVNTTYKGERYQLKKGRIFDTKMLNFLDNSVKTLLKFGDVPFYEAAYNMRLKELMKIKGLAEKNDEVDALAKLYALERVFQNDSELSKRLTAIIGQVPIVGDVIVPFTQTPANVFDKLLDYTPVGFTKALWELGKVRKGTFEQKVFVDRMARSFTGTGLMLIGGVLAALGLATGGEDKKEKVRQNERVTTQAYSIKIGDKWYSFEQLQPIGGVLAMGVDAYRKSKDKAGFLASINAGFDSMGNTIVRMSMLRNAFDIIGAVGGSNGSVNTAITKFFKNAISQTNPTAIRQISDIADDYVRETYDPNPVKQFANQFIAKIPFLSKTLPKRVDVYGNYIKRFDDANNMLNVMFNPLFIKDVEMTPVQKEITDVFAKTDDVGVLPSVEDDTVSFSYEGKQYKFALSVQEYINYQKLSGRILSKVGEKLIEAPEYKSLKGKTNEKGEDIEYAVKAELWKEVVSSAHDASRKYIIDEHIKKLVAEKIKK